MCRHGIGVVRARQIIVALRIAAIWRLGRHHAPKAKSAGQLAVDVKHGRIDAQLVARESGEALDKKRRAGFGIVPNAKDVVGAKNKDVAAMRIDEVVAELIDKNLVAGIDGAARNDLRRDDKCCRERPGNPAARFPAARRR